MGPRIWEGSIQYGREQGHKIGLRCSTDQHAGYPGSYGDGRIGVYAPALDRDAIWENMGKRHVCGVTGDDVLAAFQKKAKDFEDCLVAVCARSVKCDYIVTRNKADFAGFGVPAVTPEELLELV